MRINYIYGTLLSKSKNKYKNKFGHSEWYPEKFGYVKIADKIAFIGNYNFVYRNIDKDEISIKIDKRRAKKFDKLLMLGRVLYWGILLKNRRFTMEDYIFYKCNKELTRMLEKYLNCKNV